MNYSAWPDNESCRLFSEKTTKVLFFIIQVHLSNCLILHLYMFIYIFIYLFMSFYFCIFMSIFTKAIENWCQSRKHFAGRIRLTVYTCICYKSEIVYQRSSPTRSLWWVFAKKMTFLVLSESNLSVVCISLRWRF